MYYGIKKSPKVGDPNKWLKNTKEYLTEDLLKYFEFLISFINLMAI